jgi:glycine/D-amino acid oxidase-like deaminating enzyme/nitrite reductase/ring-hydroxylating ferredoxin subunit
MREQCDTNRGGVSVPLWPATAKAHEYPQLTKDLTVDVCIVGAGIAGLTTAYLLAKEGKSVAVLDDGPVGGGESERTTAHIANALDDRYFVLEKHHGKDGAALAAESHTAAIATIERIVKEQKIDCDFLRIDGYLFLAPHDDGKTLDDELAALHRAGLRETELLPKAPLDAFDTGPCIRFPNQAQFHIVRYLRGLAEAVTGEGGKIFTESHVSQVQGGKDAAAQTENGRVVRCASLVVATNAPINDNSLIYGRQAAYRTFVLACTVPKGSVPPMLLWDTQDPYHYIRTHSEQDDKHDLLIVGGEDHKTGQEDDAGLRFARLEKWTRKRFPMAEEVAYRWSGQVMEPSDGLAFIGRMPRGEDNVYIITGDSGNGMTHGTIGGMLVTDLVLGRKNPWEALYNPSRSPLKGALDSLKENTNVASQLTDWVTGGEIEGSRDVEPGTGRILRKGAAKYAVYRDPEGKIHTMSAVCPHRGCIVNWNSYEKSWDCPCHGSRYDACGGVLNGPSLSDLKRVQ